MEFKTELMKELNRTKFRIRLSGLYTEDYQVRMIRENSIRGLTGMIARGEGEETVYEYDVTGLFSLTQHYKQKKITAEEMLGFLKQIQEVIEEVEGYLLNPNRLLLEPDYIFCEEGSYSFCYFPQGEEDIRMSFHRLMEHFVQWTDYQDIPSVKTAFLLHKETMKENYSLKKIMKKLEEIQEDGKRDEILKKKTGESEINQNEPEKAYIPDEVKRRQEELWQPGEYDSEEHDWITRQELGSKILKETDNLWTPVKRLLHKHKRPKWGEWDGIYIDEEEL